MAGKILLALAALSLTGGGTTLPPDCPENLDRAFAQGGDAERGCCVIPGAANKCVYSNAAFCRAEAGRANLPYEFHPNVSCSALPQCR